MTTNSYQSARNLYDEENLYSEIAAVDLGSNSFRLQFAKVVDDHLIFHDSMRESVRLGAGLTAEKILDEDSQKRAIHCLEKFGERLRGLPPQAVRAVATNTFRVAKNAPQFLNEAQKALGFPIEVIAGREEARMIYVGVCHGLPRVDSRRLVIDIGGGSTEFIVGEGLEPLSMESLYMGCVSYSRKFFADGKITKSAFDKAIISAASEIRSIAKSFNAKQWQQAYASSGTARAVGEVLRLNNITNGQVSRQGLHTLKEILIQFKETKKIRLNGLSAERADVISGGLAILIAAFDELDINEIYIANSALREGVLYELLGRFQHHDTRELTVESFMRRYQVDQEQAKRVEKLALNLLENFKTVLNLSYNNAKHYISWAAKLHEIGVTIAHSGYHKHSAYIIENADMPGFSRMEQEIIASLIRAQRRALNKLTLPHSIDDKCILIAVFRLAILFNRSRQDFHMPNLKLKESKTGFELAVENQWLSQNPLTHSELQSEVEYWKSTKFTFDISEYYN